LFRSEDDDLIELLWCNGHVVMQSQNNRKLPPRPEKAAAAPAPAPAPQDDEAGLWFPFALADSLDKDIFSEFFCDAPPPPPPPAAAAAPVPEATGVETGKPCQDDGVPVKDDCGRVGPCLVPEAPCELMPPPKSTHVSGSRQQTMSLADGGDNAGDFSDLLRAGSAGKAAVEAGESSMLSAIGSSICGSNQVLVQRAVNAPGRAAHGGGGCSGSALPSAMGSANANASGRGNEATVASSSGRSDYCFGTTTTTTTTEPTSTGNRSSKRKRLDTEDSESPSEVCRRS
jgi:phytochrome-interacting factor 4